MKKTFTTSWLRLILLAVVAGSFGYVRFPAFAGSAAPQIEAFSVSSPVITRGDPLTFSWKLSKSNPAKLLSAQGAAIYPDTFYPYTSAKLAPSLSATYTLVAQNRFGSDQQTRRVEVRGVKVASVSGSAAPAQASGDTESGSGNDEADAPQGTLGVGSSADGPFFNDEADGITNPNDRRVLKVAPGGEFYIAVRFSDPDGIARVSPLLVNGRPEGLAGTLSPDRPPFSVVGAPTGDCRLGLLPTAVRCVFRVRVAEDARNISALPGSGDEFAYVFRARASDGLGNSANRPVRGYVAVTSP